jgi:hypothetical protein
MIVLDARCGPSYKVRRLRVRPPLMSTSLLALGAIAARRAGDELAAPAGGRRRSPHWPATAICLRARRVRPDCSESVFGYRRRSSLCLASRFCQPVTLQTTSEASGVAHSPACRLAISSATSSFDSFPTGVSGPPASSSTPSLPAGRGSRFHPSGRPAALWCRSPGRPLPEWSAAPAVRRHLAVPARPLSVACPRARFR